MEKAAIILLLVSVWAWFLTLIARDCSKNPSDRDKDYDSFLNWAEIPCRIITGNSNRMRRIVEKMVDKYGYHCYNENTLNHGSLIVVEEVVKGFE